MRADHEDAGDMPRVLDAALAIAEDGLRELALGAADPALARHAVREAFRGATVSLQHYSESLGRPWPEWMATAAHRLENVRLASAGVVSLPEGPSPAS